MKNLQLTKTPVGKTQILIRKPVAEAFEAFVNPDITTKFWFTKSSGRLEEGKQVEWTSEMYSVSDQMSAKTIEENKPILFKWGSSGEAKTEVEMLFDSRPDNTTYVTITNSGFQGNGDEIVAQVLDSTGGFIVVLDNLKALLEHGIDLKLIRDKFPDKIRDN